MDSVLVNSSGVMNPAPKPSTTRPTMSIGNTGLTASMANPTTISASAVARTHGVERRRITNAAIGTDKLMDTRKAVIVHWTAL